MGKEMAKFIRNLFDDESFDLKERLIVVILDNEYNPFGYFTHTMGTMNTTAVDSRLLFQKLLVVGGARFIVAHNHPVSPAYPSDADFLITITLKQRAEFLDLELIDHIILSREGYYSFDEHDVI
jgi:DNA repair protein RadC